jgi:hypothetical protein
MVYEELVQKIQQRIHDELGSRFFQICDIERNRNREITQKEYVKILTHFLYSNMDFVYVYVNLNGSNFHITDFGETKAKLPFFEESRWSLIIDELRIIYNITTSLSYDINYYGEDLCDGILKVSQASMLLENIENLKNIAENS